MASYAQELGDRYPPTPDAPGGVAKVIRTREPEFIPQITDERLVERSNGDPELLEILRRLQLRSAIIVPLAARERPLGAFSLIRTGGKPYTAEDLELALDLARRAASAVETALLFQETQRQAEAARALAHTADAVVLLDPSGIVRYWNPAAERLFVLPQDAVLGRRAATAIAQWEDL
jgi:GAF domain-containing protein